MASNGYISGVPMHRIIIIADITIPSSIRLPIYLLHYPFEIASSAHDRDYLRRRREMRSRRISKPRRSAFSKQRAL